MQKKNGLLSQYRGLRKEIYILFFGRIVTNLGSMVWPMLTMILSQKLGMNASGIAVLMVAASLIMMPANLLGGKLADRFDKKKIIIRCDCVSVVCYIVCGLVPLGYTSVALMLCASIFQQVEHPAYSALFADLTTTADRERAYSLSYLGANLGLVLSPTLAGLLFKNYLWLSFIISGVAIGCSTALIYFFVRDITPEPDEGSASVYQKSRGGESIWQIIRDNRIIVLYMIIMALYFAAYRQYNYLMPLDMGRVHGENGAVIFGTVSSLNCIVVVVFTPFITRLFARMRETGKIITGEILVATGYLLFLTLLGRIPAYYGAMLLFTWGEIFSTIADGPYLSSRIPASHRGRINGVSAVAGTIISGTCDLTVGRLYDSSGSAAAWSVVMGVLALAIVLAVVLRIRDRKAYPRLYDDKM